MPLALIFLMAFALFLSFSRGAWVNLAIALGVFGYLSFILARSNWARFKIAGVALACCLAVMGAGTIGLLATLVFKLKGMEVVTFGKTPKPYLNSDLIEELGAEYVSTDEFGVIEYARQNGAFDVIFEATGFSPIVFEAMQALAKNGVLILSSVTGGDRRTEVPADKINLDFVLGNKVMVGTVNANREYFESGVKDLSQAALEYGDWLARLLTHPVKGLENYGELFEKLTSAKGAIKVFCEVAELN